MPDDRDKPSRYGPEKGNIELQFYDDEKQVLVNKLDIRDAKLLQRREQEGVARATIRLLAERREAPKELTLPEVKKVHGEIFGDLYEWAGRYRTVILAKGDMRWGHPDFIEQTMMEFEKKCLKDFSATREMSDEDFVKGVATMQGELLAVHPFREGNARTAKLCTDLLAHQSHRPLLRYDATKRGREEYITAAKFALIENYKPMEHLVREALERAKKLQREKSLAKTKEKVTDIERGRELERKR